MEKEYARLAKTIQENAATHTKDRYLVAIAGIPGSGKTTTAQAVVDILNRASANQTTSHPRAALLSMDGFHLPRKTLDALPNREEAYIRRGAPWTFDAAGFLEFMHKLRAWADRPPSYSGGYSPSVESSSSPRSPGSSSTSEGGDNTIYAPTFDHNTKDPVENGVSVADDVSIVVVEGNYLLLDEPVWMDVAPLVDYKVFIEADLAAARERLARRHVSAGIEKTLGDGFRRVDANDRLNGLEIIEKRIEPDMVVQSVDESV